MTKGKNLRSTGIKIIGHMPWGSHLCQFYLTKRDLLEILLPYFKSGLKNNEFCMWITSEPLTAEEAKDALKKEVKNLDSLIKKGQMEILDYSRWYTKGGRFNADKVLAGWFEKERHALRKGFSGLRLTGNTFWLEQKDWRNFTEYEAKVNKVIVRHQMLAICTYSLDKCSASQAIDVVNNHQFALIKRDGKWVSVESSSYRMAEEKIGHLASFPEHNPNPVIEITFSGKIRYANPATAKILKELGMNGANPRPFIPPDLNEIIKDVKENDVIRIEREISIKDKTFIESISVLPQFAMVRIYARDFTDRKQAEQLLQRSHQELEKLVKERTGDLGRVNEALEIARDNLNRAQAVARVGSWHLDTANNVLVWSDETYRIFGLDIGSPVTYEKFLEIIHPDDREYVNTRWQAALQKAPYDIEHRIVVGGKIKWVREIAKVEFDEAGKFIRGIGTAQDITAYKQQEENSRKLQEELTHMSRVITIGELTAALAHELNQPLMAIISNAQAAQRFLAKKDPDLNEIGEILADIIKDDKRASDVINKLRALLRKSELEAVILNINDVIREVISLVRSDIAINNVSLRSELNDNIPLVSGDRIQLQQAILNLILNSFEAMKDADSKGLYIRTAQEDDKHITVSVEDSGSGIDEKNLGRLFEPFFTTKKEGMGMGLAINEAIIKAHAGRISARNNPGKGATFYFTLPVSNEQGK